MSIYYFLPLAMLTFNFALILQIFFFILVGMLLGLSLLAFNFQRFLEVFLTRVLLFFESKSMKLMILKNLEAHKMRNKLTSIIYSIALGFIIFLVVSAKVELESIKLQKLRDFGCYLKVDGFTIKPEIFDPVLERNSDII